MLVVGGLLATLVRYQLAWPGRPLTFMGKLAPEGMPGGVMHLKFERKSLGVIVASTLILGAILVSVGIGEHVLPRP